VNVALIILHADPARGGAERYTFDLAEALAKRGYEVALVATTFGPRPQRVHCVELPPRGATRLGRYLNFLDDLERHLAQTSYDIVHAMLPVRRCNVYHPHAGIAAEAIAGGHVKHAAAMKRALAKVANRINIKRRSFAATEHELLNSEPPPIVLCLSEYVKADLRRHYPALPEHRLATLFNAVNLRHFDPAIPPHDPPPATAKRPDSIRALMVAQDFERKGLREAIQALARLADPRLILTVVGKPDSASYQELARSLQIEHQIEFAGPSREMWHWYAAADFFVLPTRHDPCSLVVLEALAMGLPVISTRQNGACEIMTTGRHGFVLESANDLEGLASAMRTLCDEQTQARMRAACLALRPTLSYDRHLQTLLGVYEQVKSQSGR
jgi:UDP-glucose:(heptosyl)LPS alpha-1,3-glucosyltransferase